MEGGELRPRVLFVSWPLLFLSRGGVMTVHPNARLLSRRLSSSREWGVEVRAGGGGASAYRGQAHGHGGRPERAGDAGLDSDGHEAGLGGRDAAQATVHPVPHACAQQRANTLNTLGRSPVRLELAARARSTFLSRRLVPRHVIGIAGQARSRVASRVHGQRGCGVVYGPAGRRAGSLRRAGAPPHSQPWFLLPW